jgi:hypothetical protein
MLDVSTWVQNVLDWTEKHAGLGGWVGGLGAVLAVLLTWGLARAEYLRNRRQAAARTRSEIDLINRIISDFELTIYKPYVELAMVNDAGASGFELRHANDPEMDGMRDFAFVPVTQWPSVESYACFKRYWFTSISILRTSNTSPINRDDLSKRLKDHDTSLDDLRIALERAHESAR